MAHHLSALAETENNPEYLKKAAEITDILFGDKKDAFAQRIYDGIIEKMK